VNRRDFAVRAGAVAVSLGIARGAGALALPAANATAIRGRLPYKILFDERFEASRSFAAGAQRLGCPIQSIAGDVTALWFDELQPSWARGEGTIIGMTTHTSLFCLEQLARDHWMRVTARIEHRPGPHGTLRHELNLPEPTMQQVAAVLVMDTQWPARLAAPLVEGLRVASRGKVTEKIMVARSVAPGTSFVSLVTWAIAAPDALEATV
jgi:hypothetical protein